MSLNPGTRLGQYEIVGALGAGGMGEVYRARDPRLDREVAIKVLPAALAADPSALARFEREALSVAKLSHPNILSIFEFAQDAGTTFVVMELVDGETLRSRLAGGPLPARRAIAYALQMAKGLGAAHGHGIVHRDLKPENLMITRDDRVKILDFGLAKPIDTGGGDVTRVASLATSAGTVLGTYGYMAPEQVRGQAVDPRTDMFAFGAVLYEMLSGERAFTGDTPADSMSGVLTKDPPELDAARLSIPPGLERIVRRCLEKTPELRFQSADDLAFALETLSNISSSASAAVAPAARKAGRARAAWLPWALAIAGAAAAAAAWVTRGSAPPPDLHWDTFTRITELAGEEKWPSLSPDGATVAYAVHANGSWDIYAQRVGGQNATPILADPARDEGGPAFSPDGSLVAFHESDADGGIFIAGATGESVRRLTDLGFNPAWSPDGRQIAFTTEEIIRPQNRQAESTLYVVDVTGGAPRKVVDGDAAQAAWSPDQRHLVYWSNTTGQRDLFTVAAAGGARTALTDDAAIDWSPVWSPDGRFVYFSSDRGGAMNLWRLPVDLSSGKPVGPPEAVIASVQGSVELPSFSRDGSRLAFGSWVGAVNPVAIPFDPATERAGTPVILDTRNNIRMPSGISPDGTQVAYYSMGETQEDLFIGPIGGTMRRVTDDAARDRAPMFSPDGQSLFFYSTRDGAWRIWAIGTDGGNLRRVADWDNSSKPIVSPKGDALVFTTIGKGPFLAPLTAGSGGDPSPLPGASGNLILMDWSRDGTRLVGVLSRRGAASAKVGPTGVAVYDLQTRSMTEVSDDEAECAQWLADGRRVVYFAKAGTELVVLDTLTRARRVVDVQLPGPSTSTFVLSPDNRTIYYGAVRAESDIWIVERGGARR